MISHQQAQELHESIGVILHNLVDADQLDDESDGDQEILAALNRALELASVIVSDTGNDDKDRTCIYAAALGRDMALTVDREFQSGNGPRFRYQVGAFDSDGGHFFDVAATEDLTLVAAMLPTWTAEARARIKAWSPDHSQQADWPTMKDDYDKIPGPIPEGRLMTWIKA